MTREKTIAAVKAWRVQAVRSFVPVSGPRISGLQPAAIRTRCDSGVIA